MKNIGEIKREARNVLEGNWGSAILVNVIILVLLYIVSLIFNLPLNLFRRNFFYNQYYYDSVASYLPIFIFTFTSTFIVKIIFHGFAIYGQASFFMDLYRKKEAKLNNIFEGFKKIKDCIFLNFKTSVWIFLWQLVLGIFICIFATIAFTVSSVFDLKPVLTVIAFLGILFLWIFGLLIIVSMYIFAFYLMRDSEKTSTSNYIRVSFDLINGNSKKFALLILSFLGWGLLSVFTCGIGIIVLAPYVQASITVFYEDLLKYAIENNSLEHVILKEEVLNKNVNVKFDGYKDEYLLSDNANGNAGNNELMVDENHEEN